MKCPTCKGTGSIVIKDTHTGDKQTVTCPSCGGSGKVGK